MAEQPRSYLHHHSTVSESHTVKSPRSIFSNFVSSFLKLKEYDGESRAYQEALPRCGLSKRSGRSAVSNMSKAWERELVLFARLFQEELGRLPCALVRYMCMYG